jgi:hypothetical protein
MSFTNLLPISIFTFKSQFLLKYFFYNPRTALKFSDILDSMGYESHFVERRG